MTVSVMDDIGVELEFSSRDEDARSGSLRVVAPPDGGHQVSVMSELHILAQLAEGKKRDVGLLLKSARRTGEMLAARGKALYNFPAGGARIEGPTVQLAEALAAEYGHLWTGVTIDRIEDDRVYMRAMAIDVLSGTATTRPAVASLPPAPGKFAQKADQAARWESMQVQSAVSKAVRTTLLHALPGWFVEEAVLAAKQQTRKDVLKGKTVAEAARDMFAYAADAHGLSEETIIAHVGEAVELWTGTDIADLRDTFRAIKHGETTVERAFRAAIDAAGGTPAPQQGKSLAGMAETTPEPKRTSRKKTPPAAEGPASAEPPHDPETGEVADEVRPAVAVAETGAWGKPSPEEQAEILRAEREAAQAEMI